MRDAFLLSPYRPPTSYPVSLNPDEAAAWLSGYFALWHPAVLKDLTRPPQAASAYDHDQPTAGAIYAVPEGPHLHQPDDWPARVAATNAVAVKATPDRAGTLAELLNALGGPLADAPADVVRLFAGVGYGHLLIETLFDAASHDHLLDAAGFWADVQNAVHAVENPDTAGEVRTHLKAAAEKLKTAREGLNANAIHLLDFAIPDGAKPGTPWPASLALGLPLTVLAAGDVLERLAADHPALIAELKARTAAGAVDLVCGAYREREDAFLPPESQWWNLAKARQTVRARLGTEVEIYGRKRSALHPQLPGWLQHAGFSKAVVVSFDGALTPTRNAAVVSWPGPDGKAIDAFGREPQPAADPLTFFNLAYHLHQATTQDSVPTVALAHKGDPAATGYDELLALAELTDAVGAFTGLGRYLAEHHYGSYLGTATADDFFADYLDERVTTLKRPDPVSGFARHLRLRRRLDGAFALAALHRTLTPPTAEDDAAARELEALEDAIETGGADGESNLTPRPPLRSGEGEQEGAGSSSPLSASERGAGGVRLLPDLARLESHWAARLAARVQARSAPGRPGVLVFNPCGFTRRVALELDPFPAPIPVADPVKAAQFDADKTRLVVEVPGLGFAWVPRGGPAGTAPPKSRTKTADGTTVRNEFFEAELDPATGGLRSFRDHKTRINRLGMQLVFNPGNKVRVRSAGVTLAGPALGEVTAEGDLLDDHGAVLAGFRHRLRAWAGRPALEVAIELTPTHAPAGYPWHAYYGARFGWRDDRAALFRGVNGANTQTGYTRPCSPDYLEVRFGAERTFVFTGGLPFIQRHGGRMADVVLIPEGERATRFDLLLALDRDYPMPTAAGWTAPAPVVLTESGPPPGGTSGWLASLDLPSLLMTGLRPVPGARAVAARFIECAGFGGTADLRFARDPATATTIDGEGKELHPVTLIGGAIPLEFSAGEAFRVRAEWA